MKRFARWTLAGALALVAAAALFFATLPNVAALARKDPATTAFIERRKAELRREGKGDRIDRIVVPLSRIAPVLRRAVVLTEDQNFYNHHGVDWEATRLAIRTDIDRRRLRLGGSTITQQLAKNL
ncbi:MAG TPA: transglycosylase domain-containing protein, partial [Thermoanaerobaculia bacterium]|nr:transglycosylase domain-containing protein [Thermoanaerobaculia bacterium]